MNISIEGQKYEGKTTLAFFIACRIMDRKDTHKICIFDPKWAFKNERPECAGRERIVDYTDDIEVFSEMLREPGDAVAFRPRVDFRNDDRALISEDFLAFADAIELEHALKHPPQKAVVLLIDEAYHLQGGQWVHPVLAGTNRLATQGRIYTIQAVHAPKEIAPTMRRQMDEFYLFHQSEPVDLDAITERCGPECANIVSQLPLHHVLRFESRTRHYEVWAHPEAWYCPISEEIKVNA